MQIQSCLILIDTKRKIIAEKPGVDILDLRVHAVRFVHSCNSAQSLTIEHAYRNFGSPDCIRVWRNYDT